MCIHAPGLFLMPMEPEEGFRFPGIVVTDVRVLLYLNPRSSATATIAVNFRTSL